MKTLYTAFLLIFSSHLFAQMDALDIKAQEPFFYEGDTCVYPIYTNSKGDMMGFISMGHGFELTTYDSKTMALTTKKQYYDYYDKNKYAEVLHPDIPNYALLGDYFYVFVVKSDKIQSSIQAIEIDMKTGNVVGSPKLIVSSIANEKFAGVNVHYSIDGSKILMGYYINGSREVDKRHEKLGYCVLDKNLIKVASGDFIGPYDFVKLGQRYGNNAFFMDSKFNIFYFFDNSDTKERYYGLYCKSPDSPNWTTIKLGTNNQFGMEKICMSEDLEGNLYAFGYTNTENILFKHPLNLKLFKIDLATKTAKVQLDIPTTFSDDYKKDLSKFLTNEFGGQQKSQTYEFRPQQILFMEDGSKFLLGTGLTALKSDVGFIASYISPSGELKWTKHLFTDYYSWNRKRPFLLDKEKQKFYLVYSNYEKAQSSTWSKKPPNDIIVSEISFDGTQKDKVLVEDAGALTNVVAINGGKTLVVENPMGYTKDKKKVQSRFITISLK